MFDHVRLSTPGVMLGALAIASFLQPAPLSGQEHVPARAAEVTVRPEPVATNFGVLLGSGGEERRISQRLTHRDRAVVADLGRRVRAGAAFEEIRGDWAALVRRSRVTSEQDIDDLTRWVLREGYGEGEQPANRDPQNSRQRQRQVVQMMSSMQKVAHETAKNAIKNMK